MEAEEGGREEIEREGKYQARHEEHGAPVVAGPVPVACLQCRVAGDRSPQRSEDLTLCRMLGFSELRQGRGEVEFKGIQPCELHWRRQMGSLFYLFYSSNNDGG